MLWKTKKYLLLVIVCLLFSTQVLEVNAMNRIPKGKISYEDVQRERTALEIELEYFDTSSDNNNLRWSDMIHFITMPKSESSNTCSLVAYEYDENGFPILINGDISTQRRWKTSNAETLQYRYEYNENNQPIRSYEFLNGEWVLSQEMTYDQYGNIIFIESKTKKDSGIEYLITYDETGKMIELVEREGSIADMNKYPYGIKTADSRHFTESVYKFSYNENGKLQQVFQCYPVNGHDVDGKIKYAYTFNDNEDIIQSIYYRDPYSSEPTVVSNYTYDDHGNVAIYAHTIFHYFDSGVDSHSFEEHFHYEYDEYGRIISIKEQAIISDNKPYPNLKNVKLWQFSY